TIARRGAIDRLRRRQAYSRARERYGQALRQRPRNPRREAYAPFILNDLRGFLKKSMRTLPPLQREALELAFFKGLSHSEIAAATNAPLGTVKTRLELDRKSTRLNSSHDQTSYAVFCLKKKTDNPTRC